MASDVEWQYEPRKHQYYLHENVKRFNAIVTHRRFGKTVFNVNETLIKAANKSAEDREHAPPRYALIYPELKQGKSNAWEYVKFYSSALPREKNESELWIEFNHNNARVQILGADKPDRIRGEYFDGVAIDEYALVPPDLWSSVIRPTLSDYKGWVIFSGTPKGRNHFYDVCQNAKEKGDWFYANFPVQKTGLLDEEELKKAKNDMSEAQYMQEYECSFNDAVEGAYFGKQMRQAAKDDRITSVPYETSVPVNTAWDIGVDTTVIWFFQSVGKEIRWIDYEDPDQDGLPACFDICRQKPYSYGSHYAPWDIEVREMTSGRTRKQMAREHGFHFDTVEKHSVADRIEAARSILSQSWFDEDKCKEGIECLQHYRRKWDDDKKTWKSKPLKDWASHGADSFGIAAMKTRTPSKKNNFGKETVQASTDFELF